MEINKIDFTALQGVANESMTDTVEFLLSSRFWRTDPFDGNS